MSDCSTNSFKVPTCKPGARLEVEKPSLKKLAQLNGNPPWTLTVPYPEILPDEALDFIGCLEMNGVCFVRARERDWDGEDE